MQRAAAGEAGRGLRAPKCSRCRNHGFLVPVKGHAGHCRWKRCGCRKCHLVTERQKISAAHKGLRGPGPEDPPGPPPDPHDRPGTPEPEPEPEPGPTPDSPPTAPPGSPPTSTPTPTPTPTAAPGPAGLVPRTAPLTPAPAGGHHVDLLPQGAGPGPVLAAPGPVLGGPLGQLHVQPRAQPGPRTLLLAAAVGPAGLPAFADYGSHLVLPDCAVGSDFFERDAPQVYSGYPNTYHYHPFPLGPNPGQPSYQGGPVASGIPLPRGYYHGHGGHCSMQVPVQNTDRDYHPGFYPILPQFISPGFLPTVHYMPPLPPPPPPSPPLNILAESPKGADGDSSHSQDSGTECEPGEPPQDQAN